MTGILDAFDWLIIAATLVPPLVMGLLASKRAGESGEAYFLAGRNLPGWLLGVSVVATTFAADTPLVVSAMVARQGVAANWFWWAALVAHVGLFLFWAPLWRRAGVLTDAEFCELRYGAGGGATLRAAKALLLALPYNIIVMGWVLRGMQKILEPFVSWSLWLPPRLWETIEAALGSAHASETLTIIVLVALTTLYSTLGGLAGVIRNDLVQFGFAMIGAVILAWAVLEHWGGLAGLREALVASYGPERVDTLLSPFPSGGVVDGGATLPEPFPILAFAVCVGLRWWATPMADGGGYIAQRIMAARSEKDARVAAGVFVLLHYVVRPWPWILCGLASLLLFPPGRESDLWASGVAVVGDREMAYPVMIAELLPSGARGLLLGSLFAAFMSTVDTHLNWGSSYVAHDLWSRVRPAASPREIVRVGRWCSVLFAVAAVVAARHIESVESAWKFVAALGAGLGLPVLLRWVWWRVNAQAELLGAGAAFVGSVLISVAAPTWPWERQLGASVLLGVIGSLVGLAWFPAVDAGTLRTFYERVRPPGFWGPVSNRASSAVAPWLGSWFLGALALAAWTVAPAWIVSAEPRKAILATGLGALGWWAAWTCRPREERA